MCANNFIAYTSRVPTTTTCRVVKRKVKTSRIIIERKIGEDTLRIFLISLFLRVFRYFLHISEYRFRHFLTNIARIIGQNSHRASLPFTSKNTHRDTFILLMRNPGAYVAFSVILFHSTYIRWCMPVIYFTFCDESGKERREKSRNSARI